MPFSLTGFRRLLAVVDAVRYCEARGIPGAFVECGVWRGGSVQAMVLTLLAMGVTDRDLYLYDTFTGMTAPTERDTSPLEPPAARTWLEQDGRPFAELFDDPEFDQAAIRRRLEATGYPASRLRFVAGPVERTVPSQSPGQVALLRLDTDWYESTAHELRYLYPLVEQGGVLIVDDYGHWEGAARAVDEYFAAVAEPLLLTRVDYTGRMSVKH